MTVTIIDLLRHGQVEGGTCYRGITDDPLSPVGWEQMQSKLSKPITWDRIISSPLSRCYAFAKNISDLHQLPLTCVPDLQEIDFGDWEGKSAAQIDSEQLSQFYSDPTKYPPPNGEHMMHFQHRVLTAWGSICEAQQDQRTLLISHAGVIRIILADILGMDTRHSFNIKIDYACLSTIQCFNEPGQEAFLQLINHG